MAYAPNSITVKIDASDLVKELAFFKDLPEVSITSYGTYRTPEGIKWNRVDSDRPYYDINTHIRGLLAIKLRMEADAKAEGDSFNAKTEQAWEKRRHAENKAAAAKKAHDDLRTSPIALKALEIYNRGLIGIGPYANWDNANSGRGVDNETVREFIGYAEAEEAQEKEAAEKLAARRDAIAQSLGATYKYEQYVHGQLIRKAVDRIIALEDKAA